MIRHTGGWASGATSTRSRSSSRDLLSASSIVTMPIWVPSDPTRRTCGARILSFTRGSTETSHHLLGEKRRAPSWAGAQRRTHVLPIPHEYRKATDTRLDGSGRRNEPRRGGSFRKRCGGTQTGRTLAACLPFGPSTMSNSTVWPSVNVRRPSPVIALERTKPSSPPDRAMKPSPFSLLNRFTVPWLNLYLLARPPILPP